MLTGFTRCDSHLRCRLGKLYYQSLQEAWVNLSLLPRLSLSAHNFKRSYVKIVRGEGEPGNEARSI